MGTEESVVVIAVSARDLPHARDAAAMLMMDRPDLAVALSQGSVVLSGRQGERAMRLWWTTALLNERLVADASERRSTLLGRLVA